MLNTYTTFCLILILLFVKLIQYLTGCVVEFVFLAPLPWLLKTQWKRKVTGGAHHVYKGLSCKIGNVPVPGTSENQNCKFYEIHLFSLIFTFLYYIVTLKHIRQSYCSDIQHVVAYQ